MYICVHMYIYIYTYISGERKTDRDDGCYIFMYVCIYLYTCVQGQSRDRLRELLVVISVCIHIYIRIFTCVHV